MISLCFKGESVWVVLGEQRTISKNLYERKYKVVDEVWPDCNGSVFRKIMNNNLQVVERT